MITLIGSEKGGTGKTTISVNLAVMLSRNNEDILLIDTDKQQSSTFFFQVRDDSIIIPRVTCIQKFGKNLPKDVLDLSERYAHIIIDAGGRDSAELRYSLGVADQIIIPFRPTQLDIWTLEQMDKLILQARALNPDLLAYVLINMASTNPSSTDVADAISVVSDYNQLSSLKTYIKERVVFQRSIREGRSVVEYSPSDNKAIEEIISLYKEIFSRG